MKRLPLAIVFASLTQGCYWLTGACGDTEFSSVESFDQAEFDELVRSLGAGDTGDADTDDTDDTDVPTTAPLSCFEVCGRYGDDIDECAEVTPQSGDVFAVECTGNYQCIGGRLHEVVQTPRAIGSGLGAHLALMAHDEWASVAAFEALEAELAEHCAPTELRQRVLDAARDEVHHAKAIAELARTHGGEVPELVLSPLPTRSLEDVALENVVEAVVLETWAALRAHVQARTATDAEFGAVMAVVAEDETRHAELARDLDDWFRSQLDSDANARLDAARDDAFADLMLRSQLPMPEEVQTKLGWPDPATATHLLQNMAAALW